MGMDYCLIDTVGLRACGIEQPLASLWIDDLAGMELDGIDANATNEQGDYYNAFLAAKRTAYNQLKTNLKKALEPRTVFRDSISNGSWGKFTQNAVQTPIANLAGIQIRGYLDLYSIITIERIEMVNLGVAPADFTVYVIDINTETVLYEETFALAVGINTIQIQDSFAPSDWNRGIFLGYDNTDNVNVQGSQSWYWPNAQGWIGTFSSGQYDLGTNIFTSDNNSGNGIRLYYNAGCSMDMMLCNHAVPLALAYQYLIAVNFCQQKLSNRRLNNYNIDREQVEADKKLYMDLHTAELELFSQAFVIPCNSCFKVNSRMKQGWSMP